MFTKNCRCSYFWITPLTHREIKKELKKSRNYPYIQKNKKIVKKSQVFRPGTPLAAMFSEDQRKWGENEVIAYSYLEAFQNTNFCFILNEHDARDFVQDSDVFGHLLNFMTRTEDFIKDCHCITKVLNKRECSKIIHDMERVAALGIPPRKFNAIKEGIKSC